MKLFADDNSLFSVVQNKEKSANEINEDLKPISEWTFQWKMSFSPDRSRQAQAAIFSPKTNKTLPPYYI